MRVKTPSSGCRRYNIRPVAVCATVQAVLHRRSYIRPGAVVVKQADVLCVFSRARWTAKVKM